MPEIDFAALKAHVTDISDHIADIDLNALLVWNMYRLLISGKATATQVLQLHRAVAMRESRPAYTH